MTFICWIFGKNPMLSNCGAREDFECPLDSKEIKPVNPRGNQPWIYIGRTDAKAETPILWPPNVKRWLVGKDSNAGKDWEQEEKGLTEDEIVGWHHQLNGHGFQQTSGDNEVQGSLVCAVLHGVAKSQTWLCDWITTIWKHLKKLTQQGRIVQESCCSSHDCDAESWSKKESQSVSSGTQLCPTLCDPMNCSTPGLPVHHQLLEFTQTHIYWVSDAIQPFHPLSTPSPPAPNPSQHQSLFQWVNSSHELAKVLEFQL